jgi:hypothetical protein
VLGPFSACAPGIALYDKPGVSYTQWRRDDLACRRAASDEAGTAMDHDVYARCMREAGYHVRTQ